MNIEYYDDIIIGGGKAGKTLAPAFAASGRKTALVERSLTMIGGGCINIACIPTKTMVASAEVAHTVRTSAAYGVQTDEPTVDLAAIIQRKRSVVLCAATSQQYPWFNFRTAEMALAISKFSSSSLALV